MNSDLVCMIDPSYISITIFYITPSNNIAENVLILLVTDSYLESHSLL